MSSFLSSLGYLFNMLNILLCLLVLAFLFYKFHKRKPAIIILVADIVIFLTCSTAYLPKYLARQLEKQYPPFSVSSIQNNPGKIYIHVLGSGYSLDSSLPANARLGAVANSRLAEGIRLYRSIANSVIVCSGGSSEPAETQAEVTKKAAILLGVDSNRIETLTTPLNTMEEAKALVKLTGADATIIITTDAIHMPRAIKFFSAQGFTPFAAPANYRAAPEKRTGIKWWPSLNNLTLMDVVLHEYLGNVKGKL